MYVVEVYMQTGTTNLRTVVPLGGTGKEGIREEQLNWQMLSQRTGPHCITICIFCASGMLQPFGTCIAHMSPCVLWSEKRRRTKAVEHVLTCV